MCGVIVMVLRSVIYSRAKTLVNALVTTELQVSRTVTVCVHWRFTGYPFMTESPGERAKASERRPLFSNRVSGMGQHNLSSRNLF